MNFIKGVLIGIAVIIPGLSGSIFAVVVGLYDKILYCVSDFKKDIKANIVFLLPIIAGCATGVVISAKFILWICENYTKHSYLFFTGLVLGSFPSILRNMKLGKINTKKITIAIFSFILITMVSFYFNPVGDDLTNYIAIKSLSNIKDFIIILFSGMFSCSLMAIPGVSGSVMLMIINQYGTVYNSVGALSDLIKYMISGNFAEAISLVGSISIIIPFIIGALIGMLLIAKLLAYALKNYKSDTYYAVSGLVLGAVVILLKDGVIPYISPLITLNSIIVSIICVSCGILCTLLLDKQ